MKHLFLALIGDGFGEALQGVRMAEALVAAGDEVLFLAPGALSIVLGRAPVRAGWVDRAALAGRVVEEVAAAAIAESVSSIVLCDTAGVVNALLTRHEQPAHLFELGMPVLGLDLWNLAEAAPLWDLAHELRRIPPEAWQRVRRLLPVPFARPDAPGAYDALPPGEPLDEDTRRSVREELGLSPTLPLVLWPVAAWQTVRGQLKPSGKELAEALPRRVLAYLERLGVALQLVQIGGSPIADAGGRLAFRWLPSLAPPAFRRLLAAADLLLGFNQSASSLGSACVAGVPCLVGINSSNEPPFTPFRVWPLGLHNFLAPVLAGNPVTTTYRTVEVLDEAAWSSACRALLAEAEPREAQRRAQRDYVARVRALPGPAQRFHEALGSAG